jgi:cytochrome P450
MYPNRMDGNWILSLAPYGNRWREGRKLLHTYMHAGVASTFHLTQITAAQRLVADLLAAPQEPESLPKVVRLNVGQTIIKIVYGIDVKEAENEFITVPDRFNRLVTESMMPGRFLVDLVPARKLSIPLYVSGN